MSTLLQSIVNSAATIALLSLGIGTLARLALSRRAHLPLDTAIRVSTITLFLLVLAPLIVCLAPTRTVLVAHSSDPILVNLVPVMEVEAKLPTTYSDDRSPFTSQK